MIYPQYDWQQSIDRQQDTQVIIYVTVHDILRYGSRPLRRNVRYGPHVEFLIINNSAFLPVVICFDDAS